MVSVIIPHFNDVELLTKNLPKLIEILKKSRLEWELVVADDHSPEESQAALAALVSQYREEGVELMTMDRNKGFGPTVNKAFIQTKGEIVFVLKVDVLPKEQGYFNEILGNFKDKRVFAVSSALESVEEGKKEIRGQGIVLFFRGLFQHFRTRSDFKKWLLTNRSTKKLAYELENNVQNDRKKPEAGLYSAWPDGGSSAYRRDIFLKLGGFDELFAPFYWEDTDLGYRAWKAGFEVRFAPKAVLVHDYREGSIHRYHSDQYLKVLNLRNQWLFVGVNGDFETFLHAVVWSFYHLAVAVKNGNWDLFKALILAKLKLIQVLKSRYERGKYFVKTDEEVLKVFEKI
jgi:GT2 family glycosyltransferase